MHGDGHNDGQIHHEAVVEQQSAHSAEIGQAGDGGPVHGAGGGNGDLAHAAGHGVEAAAEEVGDTAAENGQRQAGDVLIGPEGNGQEAVQQSAQGGGQESGDEAHQQADDRGGVRIVELVKEGSCQTGNAAQVHDAGDAQIQVAGFLRQDLTDGAVHNDGAEADGGLQQADQLCKSHLCSASFPLRRMTR